MLRAIASYERSQASFDSPFGWVLFNTRGRCNLCHAFADTTTRPTTFTDDTTEGSNRWLEPSIYLFVRQD